MKCKTCEELEQVLNARIIKVVVDEIFFEWEKDIIHCPTCGKKVQYPSTLPYQQREL